ncbi:unnamed protein product [Laminaria digitata]
MKKLSNLKGVKILNKSEQISINGGAAGCRNPCDGKPRGSMCRAHCGTDPGQCFDGHCQCW